MIPRQAFWKAAVDNPHRNFVIGWVLMAIALCFIGYAIMAYPTWMPPKALLQDSP
jgi:hypothetical protein